MSLGRVLMIAPIFPPRNASGAMRSVHIAKYLNRLGWEIDVLTVPKPVSRLFSDEDTYLSDKIPPAARVFHAWSPVLSLLAHFGSTGGNLRRCVGFASRYTARLLLPDARLDWYLPARATAVWRIRRKRPDAILSCAYPFTSHLVACSLKKTFGIRWIADYGDPWTTNPSIRFSSLAARIARWVERKWLTACDAVSVTTPEFAASYGSAYPGVRNKTLVTPNGYDHEDFRGIDPKEFAGLTLLHAGNLDTPTRDPRPFFTALASLPRRVAENTRVVLVGPLTQTLRSIAARLQAEGRLQLLGPVEARESYRYMLGADMLILFGNRGAMQIPAKLYSYIACRKPLLVIRRERGDPAARIVQGLKRGIVVDNNPNHIARVISSACKMYKDSTLVESFDLSERSEYRWENAVQSLHEALRNWL